MRHLNPANTKEIVNSIAGVRVRVNGPRMFIPDSVLHALRSPCSTLLAVVFFLNRVHCNAGFDTRDGTVELERCKMQGNFPRTTSGRMAFTGVGSPGLRRS